MDKLKDIFHIEYGNQADLNKLEKAASSEGVRFISRSGENLGFQCYVKPVSGLKLYEAGCITVALGGSMLSAFVQPGSFYTAQNIKVLIPKVSMTDNELYFYCYAIAENKFRYVTHGREANKTFDNIIVPSLNEIPAWVNKPLSVQIPSPNPYHRTTVNLNDRHWSWFQLDELFAVKKGKRLTTEVITKGKTPFIGAIDTDNGYREFIGQKANQDGNTITVNYNGNGVAEAFYQPVPFWASDDVNVLYPKFNLNVYIALFIASILRLEKYRFSYGRKWHKERMEKSKIMLPTGNEGGPDFEFMEHYIKSLPYSSNLTNNRALTDSQLIHEYEAGKANLSVKVNMPTGSKASKQKAKR